MFYLSRVYSLTRRCVAIGVSAILVAGSLPGLAIACEGVSFEDSFGELEGGVVKISGFKGKNCSENIKLEDTSTVAHKPIKVLKEAGIECTIKKKGCENFEFKKKGDFCESELEKPLVKPEYEREYEFEGRKLGPFKSPI